MHSFTLHDQLTLIVVFNPVSIYSLRIVVVWGCDEYL